MVLAGAENLVGRRIQVSWDGKPREFRVAIVAVCGPHNKLCLGFFLDEEGGKQRLLVYAYDDVRFLPVDQESM